MPQVFGSEELELIRTASLFLEAAASERDIERATHPAVAAEARSRGLVPLRMGSDPIWHHPESGKIVSLTPAHSGDAANQTSMANLIAKMKRNFPTAEETAKAGRTPEEVETDQINAAKETKSKKQQAVDAARRRREQDAASAFKKVHFPFKNQNEVQQAFDARTPKARMSRPDDTVEQFASRLSELPHATRQQIHKAIFPEQYRG
jgi:hypothetical protein